jgi:hypothetical protein
VKGNPIGFGGKFYVDTEAEKRAFALRDIAIAKEAEETKTQTQVPENAESVERNALRQALVWLQLGAKYYAGASPLLNYVGGNDGTPIDQTRLDAFLTTMHVGHDGTSIDRSKPGAHFETIPGDMAWTTGNDIGMLIFTYELNGKREQRTYKISDFYSQRSFAIFSTTYFLVDITKRKLGLIARQACPTAAEQRAVTEANIISIMRTVSPTEAEVKVAAELLMGLHTKKYSKSNIIQTDNIVVFGNAPILHGYVWIHFQIPEAQHAEFPGGESHIQHLLTEDHHS